MPDRPKTRYFSGACYTCGEKGHRASACESPKICQLCNAMGHQAKECNQLHQQLSQPQPIMSQHCPLALGPFYPWDSRALPGRSYSA